MKDYYFIMNAGVKAGGEITHAVLEGKIVSAPKGYDAFTGIEAAREKLACGNIRQQMEEFGIELEIVPVNTDFLLREPRHEVFSCLDGAEMFSCMIRGQDGVEHVEISEEDISAPEEFREICPGDFS